MNHNALLMKLKHTKAATLAATLITFGALAGGANAAIVIDFSDIGSDTLITYSGTLNVTGFSSSPSSATGGITTGPDNGGWTWLRNVSVSSTLYNLSGNIAQVNDFTTNEFDHNYSSSTGDEFYLWAYNDGTNGNFIAGANYISGAPISGSATITEVSTADLGLQSVTWITLNNGDTISTTVNSVPEPSSSTLILGLSALGLLARRKRTT